MDGGMLTVTVPKVVTDKQPAIAAAAPVPAVVAPAAEAKAIEASP